ncbi:MAG: chromate efflux transporter [Pseudomonadota bacterium]
MTEVDLAASSRAWAKIGILSFGGPAAQIAMMHRVIVDENRWLTEKQFLNALNFCMLLPGPEAMQLATYSGWRMHGVLGGMIAGLLFVLPGALVILLLAALYANYGTEPLLEAAFTGVKAAVLVIVLQAMIRLSKKALRSGTHYIMALMAFAGIFFLKVPYPVIVIIAAAYGFATANDQTEEADSALKTGYSFVQLSRTVIAWLFIWWLPVLCLWLFGADEVLIQISIFFSKLAVVTFGGAYSVLAYMAQDVVDAKNWLTAREMIDGLGLAETTPGPLILVTEFVGFLAAEKSGGIWLGLAGAIVTLWVTFVPCFLWIFAGAPYIEWLSARPKLRGALSAITAAVVGVILNLAVWFALNVMFKSIESVDAGPFQLLLPQWANLDLQVLALVLFSALLLMKLKLNMVLALAVCAIGGIILSTV